MIFPLHRVHIRLALYRTFSITFEGGETRSLKNISRLRGGTVVAFPVSRRYVFPFGLQRCHSALSQVCGFEEWSRDRRVILCSKRATFQEKYGHIDLKLDDSFMRGQRNT